MSYNGILDVGLDKEGSQENVDEEVTYEKLSENLLQEQASTTINPYQFSERHLLDEHKGLDILSLKVKDCLKTISRTKDNNAIYDEIVKTYRLWAHDVNPRYKLKDTVTLINKVGKSRDIMSYRRNKIDEDHLSALGSRRESFSEPEENDSPDIQPQETHNSSHPKTLLEKLADDERALEASGDQPEAFRKELAVSGTENVVEDEVFERNKHIGSEFQTTEAQNYSRDLQEAQAQHSHSLQDEIDQYEEMLQQGMN